MAIKITGTLEPQNPENEYEIVNELHVGGGYKSVANVTERNSITALRRKAGMEVLCRDTGRRYVLGDSLTNADWEIVPGSSRFPVLQVADEDERDALAAEEQIDDMLVFLRDVRQFHTKDGAGSSWTQLDLGGDGAIDFGSFDSAADLATHAASVGDHKKLVQLRGFYADAPGIGTGFWYLSPVRNLTPGPGVYNVGSTEQYVPHFPGGLIDPACFGARPGYTINNASRTVDEAARIVANDAAFTMALAVSKNLLFPASEIRFAPGYWETDEGLYGTVNGRLILTGPVRGDDLISSNRYQGAAVIRRMNFDGPIIRLSPQADRLQHLALEFHDFPLATDTDASAIARMPGERAFLHTIDDVVIRKCAYGIYCPQDGSGQAAPNWTISRLRIYDHSICAGYFMAPGTMTVMHQIYTQNNGWPGGVGHTCEVSTLSFTGAALTVTTPYVPVNLTVGSYITVYNAPTNWSGSGDSGQFVLKTLTGSGPYTMTFDRTSNVSGSLSNRGAWSGSSVAYAVNDYVQYTNGMTGGRGPFTTVWVCKTAHTSTGGAPPTSSNANWALMQITNTLACKATRPAFMFGSGFEGSIHGLDVEGLRGDAANTYGALGIYNEGQLTVTGFHGEYYNPGTVNNMSVIKNNGGMLDLMTFHFLNSGLNSGLNFTLFQNEDNGTKKGEFTVHQSMVRDLANVGGTWALASNESGASPVHLLSHKEDTTFRANATSTIPKGSVTTSLRVAGTNVNMGGSGDTGLLNIVAGVVQTPVTLLNMVLADAQALRGALDLSNNHRDTVRNVASQTGQWGCDENYVSIGQGTCVSVHKILRDCTHLQFTWNGYFRPSTFVNPTEKFQPEYEVSADFVRCSDATGATEIGTRRPMNWSGRYLYCVKPGSRVPCDPFRGMFKAGTFIKVLNYVNSRISNGLSFTTQVGTTETGVLTADNPWPRHGVIGDATNAQRAGATLGVAHAGVGTAFDPTTYCKTKAGAGAITITNTGGVPPSEITGRYLDKGAGANSLPAVVCFGDSISQGVGAAARAGNLTVGAGRGWFYQWLGHNRPSLNASSGGNGIQYFVGANVDNSNYRFGFATLSDIAVVYLGTNDFMSGRSQTQVQADMVEFFGMLGSAGIRKIILCAVLPRCTTTDGYQTTTNQTPTLIPTGPYSGTAFYLQADIYNAWQQTQVGLTFNGATVGGYIDFIATCSASGTSAQYWKTAAVVLTTAITTGATTTNLPVSATMTANAHQTRSVLVGTNHRECSANTTGALTTTVAFSVAPADGATVLVLEGRTTDGVHPAQDVVDLMVSTPSGVALLTLP